MRLNWTLYTRNGCHLCEAFEAELASLTILDTSQWQRVDIDQDQDLVARYGHDVPVLALNDKIICQHFFDNDRVLEALHQHAEHS